MSNIQQAQQNINPMIIAQDQVMLAQKCFFNVLGMVEGLLKENSALRDQISKSPNIVDSKFKEFGPRPVNTGQNPG